MNSESSSALRSALTRPLPLGLALVFCTCIPVMMSAVRVIQIPLGGLPEDSRRLIVVPLAYFLHALAGALFGVLGPLQFIRALRLRFGIVHRLAGWVFVLAGAVLALSGLRLLLKVESITTGLLDGARALFGLALIAALMRAVSAARAHDMPRHSAWMIRAYAIGIGTGPVALVLFPVYLVTGEPVAGLASDILVVFTWLLTIALAEGVVRRLTSPGPVRRGAPQLQRRPA